MDIIKDSEEAQDFRDKVDHEGGLLSYLHWGGVEEFPLSMRRDAQEFSNAYDVLYERFVTELEKWDVDY